jgi:selenocysteine lyase/cysteine desulfurase
MAHNSFSTTGNDIYLLNHSVGRPPLNCQQYLDDHYFSHWQSSASDGWEQWLGEIDIFRNALAKLLNDQADNFCPQTNLSGGFSKVLGSLAMSPERRVIVYNQDDFPSMGFVLMQAEKAGYELRRIPSEKSALELDTWAEYLLDDCAAVLITHVHSNTSTQVDVARICNLARDNAIVSIVDVAQSAGVVPIDIQLWQPDFVLGSCVKWLCGGPGAGYLWINPDIVDQCTPTDVGWWSHSNPFDFDIHNFEYASGALRFWGGTPSVIPFVVAANSIETINGLGVETIRQHNLKLTQKILSSLNQNVSITPSLPEHRGGTLVLNFGNKQKQVIQTLESAKVRFDARATGMRLSPHIYNSEQEIDAVIECFA